MSWIGWEIKRAFRRLGGSPGFVFTVVAILALGVGANCAAFRALYQQVLRPLPYKDADGLYVPQVMFRWGKKKAVPSSWSYPLFDEFKKSDKSFSQLAAYGSLSAPMKAGAEPEVVSVEIVSEDYFSVLKASPYLGRLFHLGTRSTSASRLALLSHAFWQQRFGGARSILGRSITVNGAPLTVVGILPPGFRAPDGSRDLWVPMAMASELENPHSLDSQWLAWLDTVGRLRNGVKPRRAQAEASALVGAISASFPLPAKLEVTESARVVSLRAEQSVPQLNRALEVVMGTVLLVLLMAVVNLGGLMAVHTQARRRDIAISAALGAGRGRRIAFLLVECLLLGVLSGATGLALFVVLDRLGVLRRLSAIVSGSGFDRSQIVAFAGHSATEVAVFALVTSLLIALVLGLLVAAKGLRVVPAEAVRQHRRGVSAHHHLSSGGAMVAIQVALAVALLFAAGLMLLSLWRLLSVDTGVSRTAALTFKVEPDSRRYTNRRAVARLEATLMDGLRELPGVRAAALGSCTPLGSNCAGTVVSRIEGQPPFPLTEARQVELHFVTPGYFKILGIPLLAGRGFGGRDTQSSPPVVIVNQAEARILYGDRDAIGRRIGFPSGLFGAENGSAKGVAEIVGVAGDVRYGKPEQNPRPALYVAATQYASYSIYTFVAGPLPPSTLLSEARTALRRIDPTLAIADVQTLRERLAAAYARPKMTAIVLGFLSLLALAITLLGVYGVVWHSVRQRRREMGIRLALGARPSRLATRVIGSTMAFAAVGAACGVMGAVAIGRILRSLIFGIAPASPLLVTAVAVAVISVVALAALVPARKASRIDAMEILRAE